MKLLNSRQYKTSAQISISILFILIASFACYLSSQLIGYKIVALILMMCVSVLAMLFDIIPVLIAAILSALIWNFFFIPPVFTFHISDTEDLLMFLMYFIIAMVNAVLSFKIRKEENKVRDKEEKEKTIQLYNTLLNSLSHELRTPIATIIGAVDTLQDHPSNLSSIHQHELLNHIDIAATRLNRQVENLLNMSRLETGTIQLKLDWCDLNELVHYVINSILIPVKHKIEFIPNEQLPLFKIDRGLIEQVLQNLIHNAINYTPENTQINILVEQQQEQCIIVVSDNGNGIPTDEIPKIADKFYRLPNSKTGGSGLGLSIVKGFIEAHKGTVHIENNPTGGLKISLMIPAATSYLNNLKNE